MQNRRLELISFQVTSYLIRTPKPCRLNSSILYTKFRLSTKNFQILTRSCIISDTRYLCNCDNYIVENN